MQLIRKSFCSCCYMRTNNGHVTRQTLLGILSWFPVMASRLFSLTKFFVRWHAKVVRMTTPVVTEDVEGAHQRPQWRPGQPPLQLSVTVYAWWRHQMETFSALLALCTGNSPVTGEFPTQRPVTRSFGAFFDLLLNKRLSKQSWGWWFEMPSRSLWRHCNGNMYMKVHGLINVLFSHYSFLYADTQRSSGWLPLLLLKTLKVRINVPNDDQDSHPYNFPLLCMHDNVIKWKHFPRYWPFVRGIHRSPVNSPHRGQWRGALVLSLICSWINGWVNNREAGDLRCHRAHYDVIVMEICIWKFKVWSMFFLVITVL